MLKKSLLIESAKAAVQSHPEVSDVECKERVGNGFTLAFSMQVELPANGRASGICDVEPVMLDFSEAWPFKAPTIQLRKDFPRNLAHINPADDLNPAWVSPCVIDQPLDVYVSRHGLDGEKGLLARIQEWLDDAAANDLRKDDKGFWEPMRRDGVNEQIAADLGMLRGLVKQTGSKRVYLTARVDAESSFGNRYYAFIEKPKKSNAHSASSIKKSLGKSGVIPVLFIWGNQTSHDIFPDGVARLDNFLRACVKTYKCFSSVKSSLTDLTGLLAKEDVSKPIIILVGVLKPRPLPNSQGQVNAKVELIPYIFEFQARKKNPSKDSMDHLLVRPLQLREMSNPTLLKKLSGVSFPPNRRLRLIGCGSIGSKLAMHLGKAGFGAIDLVDHQTILPHNLARMGVMIDHRESWMPKALAVAHEFSRLGHAEHETSLNGHDKGRSAQREMVCDFVETTASEGKVACQDDTAIIFDATASQTVHDALVHFPIEPKDARAIQGAFFAKGNVAMLSSEGAGRQPDLEDLYAHFWRWWMLKSLSGEVEWPGSQNEDLRRIQLGEGCGSLTMQMSDMQASLLTAGMAQQVAKHLSEGQGEAGELSIARIDSTDRMSVTWDHLVFEPSTIVSDVEGDWEVRILPDVAKELGCQAEAARKDGNETCGYLMGMINPAIRRLTITAHLPPPPDTKASKSNCVLGVDGAQETLEEMHIKSRKAFLALGTWHSHPEGGGPSGQDRLTLQEIAEGFHGMPAISLIWRPGGYKALVCQEFHKGDK